MASVTPQVAALAMGGRNVFIQTAMQKTRRGVAGNCVKMFFTRGDNHLARFVGSTKNLDKAFKFAKSVSEFSCGVIESSGNTGASLETARNVAGTLGTARSVVALSNVFNGAIPGCISSSKNCFAHIKKCFTPESHYDLGNAEKGLPYNKIYLTKGDHALAAIKEGCSAVGAATYIGTFGVCRPVLLANKLAHKPFLPKDVKTGFGDAVTYMMTANHAASVIGGAASLMYENRAYQRASAGLEDARIAETLTVDVYNQVSQELRESHLAVVKKTILAILEKAFELIADVVKLIPFPTTASVRLAVTSGAVVISSGIGLYSAWAHS
ncbi:hypothetical protein CAB1_0097 [Chlamydia abortus LLG]|uniref:CT529 family inclusion membrane protein n=1 Tax=Chlamydia abortus TaxID=83555 RepID=UPI00029CBAB0|nr:hypothetical protein [Chlamydia abortus]EGK68871.1 hypothetical protein CAB1_0097 [Chlamydia abortus LLG]SFV98329.1 Uncharacterised protein [Chlamydia abortus]